MERAENVSQVVAQSGGALAAGSGLVQWLSENPTLLSGIGICVGIVVGVVGLGFNIYFGFRRVRAIERGAIDQ